MGALRRSCAGRRVFVPDEMVLGRIGDGWKQVTGELAYERSGPERILSTAPVLLSFLEEFHGKGVARSIPAGSILARPPRCGDCLRPSPANWIRDQHPKRWRPWPRIWEPSSNRKSWMRFGSPPVATSAIPPAMPSPGFVSGNRPVSRIHHSRRNNRNSAQRHRQRTEATCIAKLCQ